MSKYAIYFVLFILASELYADEIRTCTGKIEASLSVEPYGSIPRQIGLDAEYKVVYNTAGASHGSNKKIYQVQTGFISAKFENGDVLSNSIDDITVENRPEGRGLKDKLIFAASPIKGSVRVGGILQRDRVLSMFFTDNDAGAIHDLSVPTDGPTIAGFNGPHTQLLWSDEYNRTEELLDVDSITMSCTTAPVVPPVLGCISRLDRIHDVVDYGANPGNSNDDTAYIKTAFACANPGDTIYFPSGIFHVNDVVELKRNRASAQFQHGVKIQGEGISSQIIQETAGLDLFRLSEVQAVTVSNLFLGAYDPLPGESGNPALLDLHRVNYSRFDTIYMQGGHTGINIDGSISNSFHDIRSAYNIREPIDWCKPNNDPNPARLDCLIHQWINIVDNKDIPNDSRGANANRFYNLILEGGQHGIRYKGTTGSGSFSLFGGVISVIGDHILSTDAHNNFDPADPHGAGVAIQIETNGHPVGIHDVHIEGSDIVLKGTNSVSLLNVLLIPGEKYGGGHLRIMNSAPCPNPAVRCDHNSRGTVVMNSGLDRITISEDSALTSLINVRMGFKGPVCPTYPACPVCPGSAPCIRDQGLINDLATDDSSPEQDHHKNQSDTLYINVHAGAHGKRQSTLGYGRINPSLETGTSRFLFRGDIDNVPMRSVRP